MTIYLASKNDVEQKAYRQGWARIWAKYQGTIYPVPTEADEIIVQISPYFIMSALLPARPRQINIEYAKDGRVSIANIDAPQLLLSQMITYSPVGHGEKHPCACADCYLVRHGVGCHCLECQKYSAARKHIFPNRFQIFMPRKEPRGSETEAISLSAWAFPNVHSDGRICFGLTKYPNNLKIANNHFWQSAFNNDTRSVEQFSHLQCNNKSRHSYQGHMYNRSGHAGSCRRKLNHICNCACPNKARHNRDCKFLRGCGCIQCLCECCQGQCQCKCLCYCCRSVCGCRCDCDFNDEFAVAIKNLQTWSFTTAQAEIIFGHQHIKKSGNVDGIFISYEKKIISEAQLHYQGRENKEVVVGFAREIPDGEWEITFENGQSMILDNREVHVVT